MTQYYKIKASNPDTILLFRIGDFYETFDEDAKTASKVLGITLTKRSNGAAGDVPLAGFPHHAIDTYLPKLIRSGHRVAICEQMEDPKHAKGIVKREVTEIVTPGVAFSDKVLDHKRNNYLMSVVIGESIWGISFCDISTGEYYAYEITAAMFRDQLETINPAEILVTRKDLEKLTYTVRNVNEGTRLTKVDDWIFSYDYANELLTNHFKTVNLKGFGIEKLQAGLIAAGVVFHYLQESQKSNLAHLSKISLYNPSDYMALDFATKRNLEIVQSMQQGGREGTLISILDKTETPMGARLLKKWISAPLKKADAIIARRDSIEELLIKKDLRKKLATELKEVGDLERLISKICTGRANPRDVLALKNSIKKIPQIKTLLSEAQFHTLATLRDNFVEMQSIVEKIEKAIVENPPLSIADGGVIRRNYSPELDELRDISLNGKDWIANLQRQERERTGIGSLKVNYNRVFGYYIEISNANKDKVPADYIRKQTLVSSERYITPELKTYEEKVLSAEEKIYDLESELFNQIRLEAASYAEQVQQNARMIAMLDCFISFSQCAEEYKYIKPEIDDSDILELDEARHPVVERILPPDEKFTPNNCRMDNEDTQIILLTGPNMAGKSVYLRQIGLIVLLAQIGSFVPAAKARIGIVDRIFTRVGASDNITAGESTFLVEMQEAANILNNASSKSLILLDEIGRGTSTFDGISIAWAITEYLHENPYLNAKTLFATHYHELNEMAELFPRIKNYKVEVREYDDKVVFLHKVNPGKADHSYGIQVAQMAGLPTFVTDRAKEILFNLEGKELTPHELKKQRLAKLQQPPIGRQLNLFEVKDDALREEISGIRIDELTPLEALNKLSDLKKKLDEK
ncbi:MAG: DNA mismatch repair protein MutS [Ignavibacteriaceae bacterium]|nr:DNA mismatch repair protein MutS [Ignavibacteriaceae bacterium]